MIIKQQGDYWLATGRGHKRDIVAEGKTREEAFRAWCDINRQQIEEDINAELEMLEAELDQW